MKNFEDSKEDFDNLVDKWDKALKSDIFKPTPNLPSTAPQTSNNSFFGVYQSNPTQDIRPEDAKYWNAINAVSDGVDIPMERIDEELDFKPYNSPNPIRRGTEGPDQDLSNLAIDATFSEEDLKSLEDMKLKLHELNSKIATMEDKNSYESQVKSIIEKIDELSNKMCGSRSK